MQRFSPSHAPIVLSALAAFCIFVSSPASAQTEFDANLEQAKQQENYYKNALDQEHLKTEPIKQAYEKQLEQLKMSGGIAKHGTNQQTKRMSSLEYWLKSEDKREQVEAAELANLDGWTRYWQSKQDSIIRTQAWNAEQIHLEQIAAQKAAMDAAEEQARAARFAANAQYWDDQYNGSGYGYGGGGGYYGGGRRGYGGYHGHSFTVGHVGHVSGTHGGHGHGGLH